MANSRATKNSCGVACSVSSICSALKLCWLYFSWKQTCLWSYLIMDLCCCGIHQVSQQMCFEDSLCVSLILWIRATRTNTRRFRVAWVIQLYSQKFYHGTQPDLYLETNTGWMVKCVIGKGTENLVGCWLKVCACLDEHACMHTYVYTLNSPHVLHIKWHSQTAV